MEKIPQVEAYLHIKDQCEKLGISISEMCKRAGVDRSRIERWKSKEPDALIDYRRMLRIMNDMSASQDRFATLIGGEVIYISGKISGIEDEAKIIFINADTYLRSRGFNRIINPYGMVESHPGFDGDWGTAMAICLSELHKADALFMLKNWIDSKGAKIEHKMAELLGKKIIYSKHI